MNAMIEAFMSAGIAVPTVMERVWRTIKLEPGLTNRDLQRRLGNIPSGSIASSLSKMEMRSMIYSKGTKGSGPSGKAKAYYTDLEHYTLLAAPKRPEAPISSPVQTKVATSLEKRANGPDFEPASYVESLTVGQARELYQHLHLMFGKHK